MLTDVNWGDGGKLHFSTDSSVASQAQKQKRERNRLLDHFPVADGAGGLVDDDSDFHFAARVVGLRSEIVLRVDLGEGVVDGAA